LKSLKKDTFGIPQIFVIFAYKNFTINVEQKDDYGGFALCKRTGSY